MIKYKYRIDWRRNVIFKIFEPSFDPANVPVSTREAGNATVYGHGTRDGAGVHRREYKHDDAEQVARWLNDREQGYPSVNYLALQWAVLDGRTSNFPERPR